MQTRFILITAVLTLVACNPAGLEQVAVDKPDPPGIYPDSVRVGEERIVFESACAPGLPVCIAEVRDLIWAVRPSTILRITGTEPGQAIRVLGVSPGKGWVVATG
ncbi:MAG TPA: hypothetical protein VGQ98_03410, partial [Gemmatimonadaceae bacterium]|nr:hypothetical protein [Gemmatimonadaceae bacterium]